MANEKLKMRAKKIIAIIPDILTYVFFAVCILALILSVVEKKDPDGAVSIFGRQMRVVLSNSMSECAETDVSEYDIKDIPVKSMIFIEMVPEDEKEADEWYSELKVGDVLTFRYVYVSQETITHRITRITQKATGGYVIELVGDNKASDSSTLSQTIDTSLTDSPNYVIGKVTGQSYPIGLLVTALKSPIGIVLIVMIPSIIIAIFSILRIVGVVTADRKIRELTVQKQRDDEFEEMKRQLELLQRQTHTVGTEEATNNTDISDGGAAE